MVEPQPRECAVEPGQRLPGQPVIDSTACRQFLGQFRARRRLGQIGEGDALFAVPDEAVACVEFAPVHLPPLCRRNAQQRARAGACFAQPCLEPAHRGRSGGQHQCIPGRIFACRPVVHAERGGDQAGVGGFLGREQIGIKWPDRRRFDRDRAPVCAQFVGENLREGGPASLAQFGLRHGDDHPAVPSDLQESVEQRLAFGGAQVRRIDARPQGPRKHQACARAAADQKGPPADAFPFPTPPHAAVIKGGSHAG